MKLQLEPFEKMQNGTKTVEIRLNDEKRKTLKVGDWITFSLASNPAEKIHVVITELIHFPTFQEFFSHLFAKEYGGGTWEDMYTYYSKEDEERYGVLGIHVQKIVVSKEHDELAKIVWDYMLMHHEIKRADAIFLLGSNDIRTVDRAAELYHLGYAEYIICSGLGGVATFFNEPEAVVFGRRLEELDVPSDKIILEPQATNTGENIQFTKKLLKEKGLDFNSFILVQKPYMERRTYATFKKQWPEAECVVTSPQMSYEEFMGSDESFKIRHIQSMVGDLQRIKEYPKKGFQIEQEIPKEVWEAAQKLIRMGYTKGMSL